MRILDLSDAGEFPFLARDGSLYIRRPHDLRTPSARLDGLFM